ncbi:hypothetical protein O181_096443 [Austropuccinia psidii MF-1]|uniref:5'-deoxynucleotidase n=1 Tax=Austropuccinia psidii MF-1 TaxID=1389203 RepID=A0A9Q3PC67_9BASI|nr:hypothetical protein [Austropuccinia psidii MF-1]
MELVPIHSPPSAPSPSTPPKTIGYICLPVAGADPRSRRKGALLVVSHLLIAQYTGRELKHGIGSTTKRAGWIREGSRNPESIADHMYRMAMLAMLCEKDSQLDLSKCVMLALVHDLAESVVGDITPLDGISREEKHRREAAAIEHFTTQLLPAESAAASRLKNLWHEYEAGQSREAKFVKDLDRFELCLQAVEYEKREKITTLQSFFDTTIPFIQHSEVKSWADELMNERASIQGSKPFTIDYQEVRPKMGDESS